MSGQTINDGVDVLYKVVGDVAGVIIFFLCASISLVQVDPSGSPRTFHTDGKLFGLSFKENW